MIEPKVLNTEYFFNNKTVIKNDNLFTVVTNLTKYFGPAVSKLLRFL